MNAKEFLKKHITFSDYVDESSPSEELVSLEDAFQALDLQAHQIFEELEKHQAIISHGEETYRLHAGLFSVNYKTYQEIKASFLQEKKTK